MTSISHGLFARRYAGVLFDVAESRGRSAKALEDLRALALAVASSPELQDVFDNPAIAAAKKRAIVDAIGTQLGVGDEVAAAAGPPG